MTDEMKAKRELLFSGSKNGYDRVDQQTLDAMEAYCRDYKSFLDHSKTERECTAHTVALADAAYATSSTLLRSLVGATVPDPVRRKF